jgi:hypothetical protein
MITELLTQEVTEYIVIHNSLFFNFVGHQLKRTRFGSIPHIATSLPKCGQPHFCGSISRTSYKKLARIHDYDVQRKYEKIQLEWNRTVWPNKVKLP